MTDKAIQDSVNYFKSRGELIKVGPKGYVHGWIKVGEDADQEIREGKDDKGNTYSFRADKNLLSGHGAIADDRISVEVHDPDGNRIAQVTAHHNYGYKNLPADTATIWKYEVDPQHQHEGLATNMMHAIHDNLPKHVIAHSGFVSDEGVGFAQHMEATAPKWNRVMMPDSSTFRKPPKKA